MTVTSIALIGVAVVAIFGAIGAFAIAYRRSREVRPAPDAQVSAETRAADRSRVAVAVAPAGVSTTVEEAVEEEVAEAEAEEPVAEAVVAVPGPNGAVHIVEEQRIVEVSPEEGGVTRRQFFNRALTATFGSFLALQGLYYLSFFWPKLSGGFGADIDAGPTSDLRRQAFTADGSVVPVFIPEARAYVVPAPEPLSEQFQGQNLVVGGLMALFQRCVHLGCRVPWCATSQGFECPCHGSKYSFIGEYFAGPAPRNLDRFVVEERGDRFVIRTGTIIQTPRAPQLTVGYPQGPSCISIGASGEA